MNYLFFALTIDGGQALDSQDKRGTAFLMARLMNEGTATKTPAQLEKSIGLLGASLFVSAGRESVTISGKTLAKNFDQTMALLDEMLLSPRWDANEFERIKSSRLTRIIQAQGNANKIAPSVFMKLLYGENHVSGTPVGGTESSISAITLNDVKAYYQKNISPRNARLHVVGAVTQQKVEQALSGLHRWKGSKVDMPKQSTVNTIKKPQLYFIDLPGAKQSTVYIGKTMVAADQADFYPIRVANNSLGAGINARLGQTLRIQKGYTYGATSYLSPSIYQSTFIASSQVRTNVTLESLEIFKNLIGTYQATFTNNDLAVTKNMIIKGNTRRFETLSKQLSMLKNMTRFGLPKNYIQQRQEYVEKASLAEVQNIIGQHIDGQKMIYLVVGDAKTQLSRMKDLGYGEPIVLTIDGNLSN